ncbi:MAG: LysR substrate-binding domain-containing protein [Enterobacteriaceae bacterium]
MVLFERHSKGCVPEGGKLLLQHAQRLLNDMERSQYEIARFKQGGLVGSLKIGCSPVATDCVSLAILGLLKELPTLNLNIEEKVMTPLLHDLLAGSVDVVVGRVGGRALELPLSYRVLYTEPVCFVARPDHPLAEKSRLSWADLSVALDRLAHRHANCLSIDNALVDNGVMLPENTIESASMNVTSNLLQSSDMVSILSLRLAQRYAAQRQLAILNLPRIEQKGSVGVFWRKSEAPSLALSRFLHCLSLQSSL